jgi:hypothetical protein
VRKRRLTSFAALCGLALSVSLVNAVAPPSRSFLLRPVIVPIEVIRSGHIAIRARINGQGPYRFIFDTGAPALVISEQVARQSGILPSNFRRPFFTPLGNLGNFDVDSITLGAASQSHLQANIWNHPTVEILSQAFGRFEGLIGFPFFARYAITIDYKTKTMLLVPCSFQPEDTQQKMIDRLSNPVMEKTWGAAQLLGIRISKAAKDVSAGVVIDAVSRNGPAGEAGVKAGDRLLGLDGRWTDTVQDSYAALSGVQAAGEVRVSILRDGKSLNLILKVMPGI